MLRKLAAQGLDACVGQFGASGRVLVGLVLACQQCQAHALAGAMRLGRRLAADDAEAAPIIVVTLSGRGDKDVDTAIKWFGLDGSADASVGGEA